MQSPYGLNYGVATKLFPGVEEGIQYSQTMQDDQAKRDATRSSIDEEGKYSPEMHAAALAERGIAPDPGEAYKYGMGLAAQARGGYNQAQTGLVNAKTNATNVGTDLKLKNALIAKAANLANYIKQVPVADRKAAVDEWLEVNPDVLPEAQDHFRALADESDKELDAAIVADPLQQKLLERRRIADQTETGKNARAGASIASKEKIAAEKLAVSTGIAKMREAGKISKAGASSLVDRRSPAKMAADELIENGMSAADALGVVTGIVKLPKPGETPEEFAGRAMKDMQVGRVKMGLSPLNPEESAESYDYFQELGKKSAASRPKPVAPSTHPGASSMEEGTLSRSGKFVWKNGAWVAK